MARRRGIRNDWSDNFTMNAADLIRLQLAFGGPESGKAILMRCFKRHPSTDTKINARTVCAVLDELIEEEMALYHG